jgi:hypothetical protein
LRRGATAIATAPIAAVIVLSAAPAGHGAAAAALLRIAEIGLGASIGVAMSWVLLPRRSEREAEALSREVLGLQLAALKAAANSQTSLARQLQEQARLQTRKLFRLIQTSRWERSDKERLSQLQAFVGRLGGSIGFAIRTMQEAESVANPIFVSDTLRQRVEAISGNGTLVRSDSTPADRPRIQAHALHYALGMAAGDATGLSDALHGG